MRADRLAPRGDCLTIAAAELLRATQPDQSHPSLLLRVSTSGEATALAELAPGVETGEAQEVLQELLPLVQGRRPLERGALWERMALAIEWHRATDPARAAVLSALDLALWQLAALQAGLPLYELLGGRYFAQVDTYRVLDPQETPTQPPAGGALVAAQDDPEQVVARAEHLRRQWGDGVRLFVDLQEAVGDLEQARLVARRLQAIEVFWCLDLLPADGTREYSQLAAEVELPLGAGARLAGLPGYQRLLRTRGLDLLAVDVRRCGGLTGAQRIAWLAAARQLPVALLGGRWPLTLLLVMHLAATGAAYLPVARPDEGTMLEPPLVLDEGFVSLPEGPGVGAEVPAEVVAGYVPTGE